MGWFRGSKKRRKANPPELVYLQTKQHLRETELIASRQKRKEEEARLKPILEAEEAWQAAYKQRWAKIAFEEKLKLDEAQFEEERLKQKAIDDERERFRKIKEESIRDSYMNSPDYLMALETTHEIWDMLGDSRD
jgi:hypothetical protein